MSVRAHMPPYSSGRLIVLVAAFVAITANAPLMADAFGAFGGAKGNWLFYLSLLLSHIALLVLMLSAICHRFLVKPVLIAVLLLSATLGYFAHAFGVIFDKQMLANALQTDKAEASDLWSPAMLAWIAAFGVVPALFVARARLIFPDWKSETLARLKLAAAAATVIAISGAGFSGHYAALFREHKAITSKAVPAYALTSAVRLASDYAPATKRAHTIVAADAARKHGDVHRELVIMVVGETLRADHWALNGYPRDTTPLLRQENVINFPDFWSCGTSTAVSVPCMFSSVGREAFNEDRTQDADNALDVLARAGVSILWRDNNSSSKGVADRVTYQNFKTAELNPMCGDGECRDEGMLDGLQKFIDVQDGDIFIVLHQMGNHGPAYYKRYPKAFERFTPACQTNDLGSCKSEEIVNAYDNAALYTDYFLSKVIGLLKANDDSFETAMFYVSDHGESLGEYGLYLHGAPYAIAPEAQKHVPAVIWFGDYMKNDIKLETVAERSRRRWSHDNVFATLLGFFEVRSNAYDPGKDLLEHAEVDAAEAGPRD